jgi:hypothetical protein
MRISLHYPSPSPAAAAVARVALLRRREVLVERPFTKEIKVEGSQVATVDALLEVASHGPIKLSAKVVGRCAASRPTQKMNFAATCPMRGSA